ncbi:cytochrome P450- family 96- subfamily A-polypeptide 1 [Striga hermonthica]|uniref:Cytochrome P450- family 96- subfamily A-polypeptide 1 n=1 Tax=Striga hermonthica TaxID=68872 RepID=A0A9N7NWB9_STRHE|nr:cytochrome P450- family 96- subfamily A-polypeptide 1 [Striga hermonthica]
MTEILTKNKGTVFFQTSWFTHTDVLVTSDPANVNHVINSNYSFYQRGSEFRKAFDFLGQAAFIKDLNEWREEKRFTHAFYKDQQFRDSTPRIILQTIEEGLLPVLNHAARNNQIVDLQAVFNRYMLDATCLLATGFDLASLRVGFPESPLLDAMDDISEAVFCRHILPERVWKIQRWLGIGKEKKFTKACRVLNQILDGYVSNKYQLMRKKNNNNQETGDFDVLKFYIAYNNNNIKKSTEEKAYLGFNIMTLFFAGRDTSAALLTWFFYLISENPLVERSVLDEIRKVASADKSDQDRIYIFHKAEELVKLVYLHAALTECLRLFPTAPVIMRDPTQEDVLPSGHRVGQRTKVILCTYAMGRMSEIWGEDWAEFRPERWIDERGELKRVSSNMFLAFGSGPWACPGKEMGFTRMKGVVATIMHNYRVGVVEGQTISLSASALLTMKHGLKAAVTKRCV